MEPDEVTTLTTALQHTIHTVDTQASFYIVGSYATQTQHEQSDLDYLIVTDRKHQVVSQLSRYLVQAFPHSKPHLDIKVLSRRDFIIQLNTHYLVLYSMVSNGTKISGKTLHIKYSNEKLKTTQQMLTGQLKEVPALLAQQVNNDLILTQLFAIGKSLHCMDRILNPEQYRSLQAVFDPHYPVFERTYLRVTHPREPIQTSLVQEVSAKRRSRGHQKHKKLIKHTMGQLNSYISKIERQFQR